MAVISIVRGDDDKEELGETEVAPKNLNPHWFKTFTIEDYDPSTSVAVAVNIFDKSRDGKKMGGTFFDLATIAGRGAYDGAEEFEGFVGKKIRSGGTIYCRARQVYDAGKLVLMLRGLDLKNVEGFLKKSDPFYEISRREGSHWDPVYRSEPVRNNLSPLWDEKKYDLSILCDGNRDMPLRISVYDHESDGKHDFMGALQTSVNELVAAKSFGGGGDANDVDSANHLLLVDNKQKVSGTLVVVNAHVI